MELNNQVAISGEYGNPSSAINFSSNLVTTTIVQGLTVTKSADKTNWVDGPLTYTVVIQNNSGSALSSGKLTDTIDTSLVDFNQTYGVKLDNETYSSYTYTSSSGILEITLPNLDDSNETTITFQVTRKV